MRVKRKTFNPQTLLASAALAAISLLPAAAPGETWDSGGANSNWSTGLNWNTNLAPANDGTANIFFGSGANTSPNVDAPWDIHALQFNAAAASFTISGSALTIRNGGVTNNSPNPQSLGPISLGANQLWTMNAGTLTIQNNLSTLGFDLQVDGAGTLALARAMTGAGGLTKTGAGTLFLGNGTSDTIANTYTGLTDVFGGTVILDKAAGTVAIARDLIAETGSTITANRAGQFGAQSNITLNGGIINFGPSNTIATITLYSGGYSGANGATLNLTSAAPFALTLGGGLSVAPINLTSASGGGVKLLNNNAFTSNIFGNINLGGITREFNIAENTSGADLSLTGIVSSGGILKTGPGTLALTNPSNNYLGFTIITSGEVDASSDGALGGPSAGITFTGGVLRNTTAFSSPRTVVLQGAGTFDTQSGPLTLTGPISGNGAATKWNNNSLIIGGGAADTIPNAYNGLFTVMGGTLTLDKAAFTLAVGGDISLTNFGSLNVTRLGELSQSANIYMATSGTLTLAAGGYHTIGSFTIFGGGGSSGDMTLTSASPSALTLGCGIGVGDNFFLSGPAGQGVTLANNGPYASFISGSIGFNFLQRPFTVPDNLPGDDLTLSGSLYFGSIQKLGAGTLALTNNFNSLTTLTISEGTIRVPSIGALSGGNIVIGQNGTLQTSATFTSSQPIQSDGAISTDAGTTLTIGSGITGTSLTKSGPGELLLLNANHTFSTLRINEGTATLSGGSLAASVTNNATFKYMGGSIAGPVSNYGTFILGSTLTLPAGMTNYASFDVPLNTSLISNGPGLSNFGTINLAGGTLDGAGTLNNWGKIIGSGTITGGAMNNTGQISASGLLLLFSQAPSNLGEIDVPAGSQLNISAGNLVNSGNITLGGLIYGSAQLINSAGGTLTGHGVIANPITNSGGNIVVTDGTLNINSSFTNTGTIALAGVTASLGGGTITNLGSIHGFGNIANVINNNAGGTIEATGGNLTLSGNGSTNSGLIAASAGNKVLFAQGLTTNAGVISLSGGTFDNNGRPLANSSEISGYGSFRSSLLTNNGSITFTGGFTTINGNVINAANRQIKVAYNPALFTGNVTNNGFFKSTSTTVTFAATYTENGTFISDPADNYFNNVNIGPTGAWVGGVGDRFFVSGDFLNQSGNATQWDTVAAELHLLAGSGDLLAVNGKDLGITFDGYHNNFAWGTLSLAAGRTLTLIDADAVAGGAIYADQLDLAGGIAQIAQISGNGLNIYYNLANPGNAYLNGMTYQLAGGGTITPVPEPAALFVGLIAAPLLAARPRRISMVCFSTPRRRA